MVGAGTAHRLGLAAAAGTADAVIATERVMIASARNTFWGVVAPRPVDPNRSTYRSVDTNSDSSLWRIFRCDGGSARGDY